jgi:phage/conjugal plasmid C-4 type zinc finger TraR family protein
MPDPADEASLRVDAWNAACLERTRAAQQGEGAMFCEDCEAEIPARRREAYPSATRCVKCQEKVEGRRRG